MHKNRPKMPKTLPWWPKQLPWTSLRMMLDFPDACMPWIIMPPLVGRSDDKCSRTSRKSHFRPTNVVLDMDGTSKNRGLSGQFSLLKAGKIKNIDVLLYRFLQALTILVPKIHFISILGGCKTLVKYNLYELEAKQLSKFWKKRDLSGQFSLLKAGKIKKEIRMKSWTFYWISSSRRLFFWRITVHTMSLKFLFPIFFSVCAPLLWRLLKDYQCREHTMPACQVVVSCGFFFDFWSRKNKLVNSNFNMLLLFFAISIRQSMFLGDSFLHHIFSFHCARKKW